MNDPFLIDSHCHLDLLAEKGFDIDAIIADCLENKVQIIQTICTKISQFDQVYQYAEKYKQVFASVGIHPCNVEEETKISAQEIVQICQKYPRIIGIGETGLDYFHPNFIKENQIVSFLEHIKASRETGKPVIIHSRNADFDMAAILKEEMRRDKFKSVLHCFSSSPQLAEIAVELGVFISISGIITFKNAVELRNIVKYLPLELLLIETDAPYLAPLPYRGKVNQPQYVKNTAEFLADLRGISLEEVAKITTNNFCRLFQT